MRSEHLRAGDSNLNVVRIVLRVKTILKYFDAMKKILTTIIMAVAAMAVTPAEAQFYEIANQLPSLISPALSGSMKYRGIVDAHYLKGIGNYNADFLGASTSQGFQYQSWFFMGVGIGVDVVFSHPDEDFGSWGESYPDYARHSSRTTGVMIPIFTDFRFNIGNTSKASFFADVKVGCSFLVGKDYMRIGSGYLTNQEYFYLRPSIGVRIPTGGENSKQAFNVGIEYQLLTSDYWSSWNRNVTLNSLGAVLSYEW